MQQTDENEIILDKLTFEKLEKLRTDFIKVHNSFNPDKKISEISSTSTNTNSITTSTEPQSIDADFEKRRAEIEKRKREQIEKLKTAQKQKQQAEIAKMQSENIAAIKIKEAEVSIKAKEDEAARKEKEQKNLQDLSNLNKQADENLANIKEKYDEATNLLKKIEDYSIEVSKILKLASISKLQVNNISDNAKTEYDNAVAKLNAEVAAVAAATAALAAGKKPPLLDKIYNYNVAIKSSILRNSVEQNKVANDNEIILNEKNIEINTLFNNFRQDFDIIKNNFESAEKLKITINTFSDKINKEKELGNLRIIQNEIKTKLSELTTNLQTILNKYNEIKNLYKNIVHAESILKINGLEIDELSKVVPAIDGFPAIKDDNKGKIVEIINHQIERFRELFVFLRLNQNNCVVFSGTPKNSSSKSESVIDFKDYTLMSKQWNAIGTKINPGKPDTHELDILYSNISYLKSLLEKFFPNQIYFFEYIGIYKKKSGGSFEPDIKNIIKDTERILCGESLDPNKKFPPMHSENVYHVYSSNFKNWNFEYEKDKVIPSDAGGIMIQFFDKGLGRFGICTMPLVPSDDANLLKKPIVGGGRKQIFKQTIKQNFKNKFQKNHTRKSRRF